MSTVILTHTAVLWLLWPVPLADFDPTTTRVYLGDRVLPHVVHVVPTPRPCLPLELECRKRFYTIEIVPH
jgi:hypothetical protein